ncbi:MFS transporter-like protein [Dothidotthia symphoricarpi CBS 119687]|uniref:MFS transporter-like protein n=1 Tax=Dothidotthia symphoricarpi CBS 119687 TaxID=1392245 RepID=A0A6A6AGS9_9PLEO|nr:MFS transporter-like protein [Dothidotthia symphoricarpi CBS 119687]KAF2130443.1 MFS transporter-like protein [Dothidotthia symphoricarpi CBS 119687]
MASQPPVTKLKNDVEQFDTISVAEHDDKPQHVELDKFGAAAKYFLNFMDRNAIVNGKLNGLDKDIGLHGTQYNTCVSIFFVGYLVGQVPSNMLLTRIKPAYYMSGWMLAWAVVSTLMAIVKDYKGMLACRFVLGITEAPFYPGGVYLISAFYNRKESATRMSIFYTGNLLASSFSGLIAAGVFAGLDGKHGLEGWRWLFIIQGVVTVGAAVLAYFMLPNAPLETRWLTQPERELAHGRIFRDTTGRTAKVSTWTGLREACCDYRTWLFALMQNLHLSANGFKNFLPSAVATLGFSTTVTLVLTCPPYLIAVFTSVAVSWSSGRFNERTWHISVSKLIAIIGFIVGTASLNIGARYFAIILFVGATYGVNNINLSWAASVLGQTDEKKTAVIAIVNTLGNLSFVYTPYLWPDSDAPRFSKALYASAGFSAGVVIVAWVIRVVLQRDNKKIRAQDNEAINFYVY